MYNIVSRLLIYSGIAQNNVVEGLCHAIKSWQAGTEDRDRVIAQLHVQAAAIVDRAASWGFEGNLWHLFLTEALVADENAFALACEGTGATGGTLDELAKRDLKYILELFHFDFTALERALEIDCFSAIGQYRAGKRRRRHPAAGVICALCVALEQAQNEEQAFDVLTAYYRDYGVGDFGLTCAFRLKQEQNGEVSLLPVYDAQTVCFDDLIGYEQQKQELRNNTRAFVEGKGANNVLLYGDSGTGKSTCVKAALNEYRMRGLRMIEIYKHQFATLAPAIAKIKNRNYKFIIFIDDLSFEEHEIEYKFLKAVIEGGVENRPRNVLIYATSNRRHLIRETWTDRNDMEYENDLHRSDTIEEKLSLSQRFGVLIRFDDPDRNLFFQMVDTLARKRGLELDEQTLHAKANAWEMKHGGLSGRTAHQFIDYLAGQQ